MYLDFTASTEKGRNQLHLHVAFGHHTHFVLGSWKDKVCLLSGPNGTFVLTHAAPPCNTGGFREALHVWKTYLRADHTEEWFCQQNPCFPLVQCACQALLCCCCRTCFSGGFWAPMKVNIISAFQLKVHSHTTCQCHFCVWSKQPIKSRGGGLHY